MWCYIIQTVRGAGRSALFCVCLCVCVRVGVGGMKDDVVIALQLAVYYSAKPEMYA